MCGKFTQPVAWQAMFRLAQMGRAPILPAVTVTPMRFAAILRLNERGARETVPMRWGFSKVNAMSPGAKPDHIHARAETIEEKPTFREAFRSRRGLLMVSSFNEAREITPTRFEQLVITPDDGAPIAIAVLWEGWQHANGDTLLTFVMVTTPPNALIGTITDRMPAIVGPDDHAKWLGEEPATPAELKALLKPYEAAMTMRPEKAPKARAPSNQGSLF
jgi:putative SOS response-associated peptidase YedK